MKKFRFSIAWLAVLAMIFTSCSKEESSAVNDDQDLIQLTFGSALNNFNDQTKQATPGECREGTPDYVLVGITDEMGNYIDDGEDDGDDLIEVGLKWNTSMGVWETTYSDHLALPAGEYNLEHFIVYDTNGQVLWVAPRTEGTFADYVTNALPHDITLAEGTKPYITVDVLCYYSRNEEAYGYLFFDINLTEVENSYCLFVNYCDEATGRDYPAYFTVEVWSDAINGTEEVMLNNDTNSITMSGDWPSASVLCFALPDLGNDTYYARVTVMNHADLAYTADATDFYDFEITQASIDALETQVPAYHHVQFECGEDTGGGDEECDVETACSLDIPGDLGQFCEVTSLGGSNNGWVKIESAQEMNLFYTDEVDGAITVATVDVSVDANNAVTVVLDTPENESDIINETDHITAYAVEVRPSVGDAMSTECWESQCANLIEEYGSISNTFDGLTYEYPVYVKVSTVSCYTPATE